MIDLVRPALVALILAVATPALADPPAYDPQKAQRAAQDEEWRADLGGLALEVQNCLDAAVSSEMRGLAILHRPATLDAVFGAESVQRCYSSYRAATVQHGVMTQMAVEAQIRGWIDGAYKAELRRGS